jgi:multiple sugar transport system substrate-binding protein
MSTTVLKGITWGHSRGITPLLAFSQRFSELHPGVEVSWQKRTLQEFADFPIEKLTETYDLLIIDHPWVGCAAATRCVLPLEQHLSQAYLNEQADAQVGRSHSSYEYAGSQWALAIDAATPVASYRQDLLEQAGRQVPQTWEELLQLAREGKVAVPAIPIDTLMNFYMFCITCGQEPFQQSHEVIDRETGLAALDQMQQLYSLLDRSMFTRNPIAVAELMTQTDQYWYCPFAYGYSNYARKGYAPRQLTYTNLVACNGTPLRSTLGGTGLAVSAFSRNRELAVAFAQQIVSPEIQSTLYVENGGQPGHRSAWLSETANYLTNGYFTDTLSTLDDSYIRPRYNGYLHFQDHAGDPVQQYLLHGGNPDQVLEKINEIYRQSQLHTS